MAARKSTKTSTFGTSKRESHNSSLFYNSRMYHGRQPEKKIEYVENKLPDDVMNRIFCKSSEKMDELPDSSIHIMITSPPYNASKEYDKDMSMEEYLDMLYRVFKETHRVLVPGGRACINLANLGRKPYIPLHSYVIEIMENIGFFMRGEIIWNKSAGAGVSTAWGSWKSASNPCLRDVHEYILIFCKDTFKRQPPEKRESTISKEEFLEWTKSLWTFPTASAKKTGHPAPFPTELPRRLIHLYTFLGENVLDPFAGSGSTLLAACEAERNYVGYDLVPEYVELAKKRIEKTPPAL